MKNKSESCNKDRSNVYKDNSSSNNSLFIRHTQFKYQDQQQSIQEVKFLYSANQDYISFSHKHSRIYLSELKESHY